MPALRAFLRTQDYPARPAPQRATGPEMSVVDAEVERDGRRIAFSDAVRGPRGLEGVNAYVLTVEDDPFGGWFGLHVTEAEDPPWRRVGWQLAASWELVDDGDGRLLTMAEFPNGVEWSACAGGPPWLVYSAWAGERRASPVQIHRRQRTSDGGWESPFDFDQEVLTFVELAYGTAPDRYLVAPSDSVELSQRIYLFVALDAGVPWRRRGEGTPRFSWCVDRGAAPTTQHDLLSVPPDVNVASSPVRLVPDVYACVALVEIDESYFELQWWSLYEDTATGVGGHQVTVLHRYRREGSPAPDTYPVSVGCRRYPGESRFLVYAIWQDLTEGRSWIDSFQVEWSGPIGGDLRPTAPAATEARVVRSRRILPRLEPNDGRAFVIDDESFTGPGDGLPYVVGSVAPLGGPDHSPDVQPVRFHTICVEPDEPLPSLAGPPVVHEGREIVDPLTGEVVFTMPDLTRYPLIPGDPTSLQPQLPRYEAAITPDTPAERTDAEPVIVDGRVFVFYIRVHGLEGRFWRAEGLP